jgi:phage terminase large subunit-like protein
VVGGAVVKLDLAYYERVKDSLDPALRREIDAELALYAQVVERNPLQAPFEPHSAQQREFFLARTPVIAAFAGNRFGKTTSLVVRALSELCDEDCLPEFLRGVKRFQAPVQGWIVVPTTDKLYDTLIPAFQKWVPKDQLEGGKWQGAWSKERRQLTFANGSTVAFKTYEQDPSTLGGAALHFVGYDEPPPKATRDECLMRLVDFAGYEMFAMTPLKTNTGWVRREIWKKRESPDVTVVKGSIHDNPMLDQKTKDRVLGSYSDLWRQAREFGDFVDVGGLIYPDFDRCVVKRPFPPEFIRSLEDILVAIDPGIRNAGIVFLAFDSENVEYVFKDFKLQDKTAADYAAVIKGELKRWGIPLSRVMFTCDPAARQRGQANATTVISALAQEGIHCNPAQNDVEAGIDQVRTRMQHDRFWVSPECRYLRDEADDYAAEEPAEGKDDSHLVPIKGNDHVLDAVRYGSMERFWDPQLEADAPRAPLGFQPDRALPASLLRVAPEAPPMGAFS